MKRRCRRWSQVEDGLIRQTFPEVPAIRIAASLNRTPAAVIMRACRLGMKRRSTSRILTDSELSEIKRAVIECEPWETAAVAENLGISVMRIKCIARENDWKRPRRQSKTRFSEADDKFLKENYGVIAVRVIAELLGRTPPTIYKRLRQMGIPLIRSSGNAEC